LYPPRSAAASRGDAEAGGKSAGGE